MNRHGRSRLLAALARSFVLRCEEAQNQVEARVTSAVELDKRQRRVVEETTREITGKAPIVQYRVDPQVIGGLILQVGDVRYDNSVRQQLDTMRDELFERAERGLQVAVAD
jgi:F-type H+-transporting ATPase subunit delta